MKINDDWSAHAAAHDATRAAKYQSTMRIEQRCHAHEPASHRRMRTATVWTPGRALLLMPRERRILGVASVLSTRAVGERCGMWLWWWFTSSVVVGCLFAAIVILVARSRQKSPRPLRETGTVLAPPAGIEGSHSWRRVGAGILAGSFGKVTASWPLVVLEVHGRDLVLRIRPRLLAAAFGARPVHESAGNAMIFPARGWFGSRHVGIKTAHGEGYFRASNPAALLAMLEAAGFEVSWTEMKIVYL
jgi:hypothetical protein